MCDDELFLSPHPRHILEATNVERRKRLERGGGEIERERVAARATVSGGDRDGLTIV